MRRFALVALALVAGYAVIFGLAYLLLSGDYSFDPDGNGTGCRSLTAESESDAQLPVIILGLLFGAWSFALGTAALLAIPRRLSESLSQIWRLAMGVVIGLFSVCFGFVVFYHDGLALIYLIFAVPVALLLRLFVAVSIVAGTREEKGTGKAVGDELLHATADILVVAAFLVVAVVALAGLFAGPLDAIAEISTC